VTTSPIWWVLLSSPPAGLVIREDSGFDGIWAAYDDTFSEIEVYREDRATLFIELGDERWVVRSYVAKSDPDGVLRLHAVFANEPPPFGWWMPSFKREGGMW